MRQIAARVLFTMLVPFPAISAEVGIGVSIDSDDSAIFVPIDLSSVAIRLEPFVEYSSFERKSGEETTSIDAKALGIGIFGTRQISENLLFYYGGRLAYVEDESVLRSTLVSPIGLFQPTALDARNKSDGYMVRPSMGIEYYPLESFSIGLEIGLEYTDIEGESSTTGLPLQQTRTERTETHTSVILRYLF